MVHKAGKNTQYRGFWQMEFAAAKLLNYNTLNEFIGKEPRPHPALSIGLLTIQG